MQELNLLSARLSYILCLTLPKEFNGILADVFKLFEGGVVNKSFHYIFSNNFYSWNYTFIITSTLYNSVRPFDESTPKARLLSDHVPSDFQEFLKDTLPVS